MNEISSPIIFLKGVTSYHLNLIVDFVYLGEVEVPEKDLSGFLEVAGDLKIRGLSKYAGAGSRQVL